MFENEYTMNKKLIKEYVLRIIGKRTIIMGIFLFIFGLAMYFIEDDVSRYAMLTCSLLGIFCAIATPIIMIDNFEKAAKRLNNGKIEKTKVIFNDNIIMDEGKAHLEFEYSQIEKVLETPNFIVLKLGDNSSILVLKEGFIKGNRNEFLEFIKHKKGEN